MPEALRIPGATATTLLGYLIGLGVLRIVARQADPAARACWRDDALELYSKLDADALESFLLDRWVPSPVISPWNGGSGFFPKDDVKAFTAIEANESPRLEPFRAAIGQARAALVRVGLTEKPDPKTAKPLLLRELRATLADDALEWLDAAVVLVDGVPAYPPVLASGGIDGRYDIANNYAQAVVFALGLRTPGLKRQAALAGCLWRTPGALEKMSLAHFFRDASPVNSPAGESDALGNPWDLALAVEGSLLLAPGAARRLDAGTPARLAAPFTMGASAAGYGSAVDGEKGKAELWLPLWRTPASLAEIEVLFREARAQVARRAARDGLDAARAAGELGVARGVVAFQRFSILERAGQANMAVPAGRIEVRARPATQVLRTLDPWLTRVLRHAGPDTPHTQRDAIKQLEQASFAVAATGTPSAVAQLLGALGRVEGQLAIASDGSRPSGLRPIAPPAQPWLDAVDLSVVEMRVAIALASVSDPNTRLPALRDYLHGTGRDERARRRYGIATTGRVASLAPVAERLAAAHQRRHQDAARADRAQLGFTDGVPCSFGDLALLGVLVLAFGALACQPRRDWVARLRAGRVAAVTGEALLALRLSGHQPIPSAADLQTDVDGVRLAAALLGHIRRDDTRRLAARLTLATPTPTPQETAT